MPKSSYEIAKARAAERAEQKLLKQQQTDEAMAQERARQQAVLDRTEKLKRQRLAKKETERSSDRKALSNTRTMSGDKCREARRLLGWSIDTLAHTSGIGRDAISNFELAKAASKPESVAAIVGALEQAGVEVTEDDVRLKPEALNRKRSRGRSVLV